MPRYKVIADGYHGDKLFSPKGKRKTLTVDKAFKKCPSWLEPIVELSAKQRSAQKAAATRAKNAAAKKAEEDKTDIDEVTFTAPPAAEQVESL